MDDFKVNWIVGWIIVLMIFFTFVFVMVSYDRLTFVAKGFTRDYFVNDPNAIRFETGRTDTGASSRTLAQGMAEYTKSGLVGTRDPPVFWQGATDVSASNVRGAVVAGGESFTQDKKMGVYSDDSLRRKLGQ